MKTKICKYCNSEFILKRSSNVFCCRSCQAKWLSQNKISGRKRKGVLKVCKYCGDKYYVPLYRQDKTFYCGRSCLAKDKLPKYVEIFGFKKQNNPPRKYKTIVVDGIRIREHRYVMEQHLGRKLLTEEQVHHLDGDGFNNDISNLIVLTNSEHQKLELTQRKK